MNVEDEWLEDPYAAPQYTAGDELDLSSEFDPDRDFSELIRLHKKMNRRCLLFGVLGFGMVMAGLSWTSELGALLILIGSVMLVVSFTSFARMRGLSGWWGLIGLTGLLGLIVLLFLPKHCLDCDGPIKSKKCTRCGAPGPP